MVGTNRVLRTLVQFFHKKNALRPTSHRAVVPTTSFSPLDRGWRPHFASYGAPPKQVVRKRRAACPQATGRGLERLITCAPEARRARADLNPRVEKVRPFVSWFRYPGRPRGGLTNRPVSSLFQQCRPPPFWEEDFARAFWLPLQANTLLPLSHSVEKRNCVRPLTRVPLLAPFPSCTPLLGPMPSGAYVSPYWVLLLRGCPWLFTNARPSSRVPSLL
jgi:hypothetical protein